MELPQLKKKLKKEIIQYLNLLDITPDDIKDDTPLFGEELGLDSIDSIEMIVLLEREYGIKINNPVEGRKILVDVNHMAEYIQEHANKKP
ncbi:MAG: acyl carrier protein [Flavobacteriales bacterium CG_4_10_14_0_2_um_filter_32_8]|nr:MAG: acyl carrier protein [Flavobacteriales bacterium CG_4_10_14_0_2_um_filter_32_8]PJB15221.1 MAG: acyl carrier protein [Flavobacteriales bacterium CG_4_9_14_3_um_filter_32_8]